MDRIKYISFKARFVDNPQNKEEMKRNPDKLAADMVELKQIKRELKQLYNYEFHLSKKYKTVEACMVRIADDAFDPTRVDVLQKRKLQLIDAELAIESKPILKQFKNEKANLHLHWTFIPITELDEVKKTLINPRVRNVIFIHHTLETGQLVDSNRHGYPETFFNLVSPNLNSLSIYACHSSKTKKLYRFEKQLALSENSNRVFMTARESKFLGQEGVAPMATFKTFLKDVDETLFRQKSRVPFQDIQVHEDCLMTIEGITPLQSDFGVFIGGYYIGSIKEGQRKTVIPFQCSLLSLKKSHQSAEIRLTMLSIFNVSNATIDSGAQVSISGPSIKKDYPVERVFTRDANDVSSIKIKVD